VGLGATLIDKEPGQVQVAPLAGDAIELDQRQLDFLVPGVTPFLAWPWTEHRGDIVGVAAQHVEQFALAGALVVGHRRLDQVSGAVQLVHVA